MKVIDPVRVTDATLASSTVPEADYSEWSAGATYAAGDRVMRASAHRIYESAIAGNIGHNPAVDRDRWIDAGPTNRWAMFDLSAGPRTVSAGNIVVALTPGVPIGAIGLVDLDAASVRVQVSAGGTSTYDVTRGDPAAAATFLDLPRVAGQTITITATPKSGQAAIGKVVIGDEFGLGETETGPTVTIADYSRRETDDFGVTTVVARAWAKRVALRSRMDGAAVDEAQRKLAAVRAQPALWIGEEGFESLTVYGFYKEFSIDLQLGATSYCSLTIEGLPSADTNVVAIDPSPAGASNLKVVRPIAVAGAVLRASSVAETDYPEWSGVTAYGAAARVIKASTHRIYESLVAANVGHDPASDSTRWIDAGPTNRWAMFDQALGSATSAVGQIAVTLSPSAPVSALAVLDTNATSVRVQAAGYDQTRAVSDRENLIAAPTTLDQATFARSAFRSANPASSGRPADRYRVGLVYTDYSQAWWCAAIPCVAGETLYYGHLVSTDYTMTDTCDAGFFAFAADASFIGAYDLPATTFTGTDAIPGVWVEKGSLLVVPAGAAFIQPYVIRPTFSGAGTFFVGEPLLSREAPSAAGDVSGTLAFLDLPSSSGDIVVTLAAAASGSPIAVGTLLIGTIEPLGLTEDTPTVGINDFSRKETDDFGNTTLIERAWAKRMALRSLVATSAVDGLLRRVASLRATPALWIGEDGLDSLTVYGFFRDFSVEVASPASIASLTIEGLTKAEPLQAAAPPPNPVAGEWTITATSIGAGAVTVPALVITGSNQSADATDIVFDYRIYTGGQGVDDDWVGSGAEPPDATRKQIVSVLGGAPYQVSVRYGANLLLGDRLILGPATTARGPTRNDDGANMLAAPDDLSLAEFLNGAGRHQINGEWYIFLNTPNALAFWGPPVGNLVPGETLHLQYRVISDGGGAETCNSSVIWYRPDGSSYAENLSSQTATRLDVSVGGVTVKAKLTVPADAILCRPYVERPVATGYTHYCNRPVLDRHESGADVTAGATSADTQHVAGVPATTVNDSIAAAQSLAGDASSMATTANAFATDVADHGKFSKDEKKRYINLINGWDTSIPALVAKGYALGLSDQAAALSSAYTVLKNYLISIGYSDLTHSNAVNRSVFLSDEQAFSSALTALSNAAKGMAGLVHANALYNGSLKLGISAKAGWDAGGFGFAADWRGNVAWGPAGAGGTAVMTSTKPVNVANNEPVVLSATLSGAATPLAYMFVDIHWVSGGNGAHISYSSGTTAAENSVLLFNESQDTVRRYRAMNAPAATDGSGFVRGYVRVVDASDVARTAGQRTVALIKVERGSSPTAFTDEATDGANVGNAAGRFTTGTHLPTNWNIGIKAINVTGFVLSDSAAGSTVTVNVGASTYTLDTGASLSYPSATIPGLAYGTTYYAYRTDPNLDGGSGYGVTTSIAAAAGTDKVYLGYFTTRATAGTTGGGGGGGRDNCVAADSWIAQRDDPIRADQVLLGDYVIALAADRDSIEAIAVEANSFAENECVRIVAENGASVVVAINTPIVTRSGRWTYAANAWMGDVPTLVDGAFAWSKARSVEPVGRRRVAKIVCHDATYAAGETDRAMILTHNPVQQKQ